MRQDNRQRARLGRPRVEEVDFLSVDRRDELRNGIDLGFLCAPIESRAPVLGRLPDEAEHGAVVGARARQFIGPARLAEAGGQFVERRLRHTQQERLDEPPWTGELSVALERGIVPP